MSDGKISRFVFTNAWMRADDSVKWHAFMPNPKDQKTSVFRTDGLPEIDIWNIGIQVGSTAGRDLKGRADLSEQDVINVRLRFEDTPEPPRHANIVGWSPDKADNISRALELERVSTGHRFV